MSLILFLALFFILWLLIEVFSIIFKVTGLELSKARFQIISILTHTGFTTRESELIVQHPVRRKLASILMIISYVAQISLITLLFDMLNSNEENLLNTFLFIGGTLLFMIFVSRNKYFTNKFDKLTENLISKSMMRTKKGRIDKILNLSSEFSIYELVINENSPMCNKTLREAQLKENFIQVLKIDNGYKMIDFPTADTLMMEGDRIVVYGKISSIIELIIDKSDEEI